MRVAILGNAGSGKSTLARALAIAANARILDLDTVAWEPDQPAVPRDEERARIDVREFCRNNEAWVVEGCYANLIDAALVFGPKLILLNPGQAACASNCRSRPWEPHKYASKAEQDANLEFLLSWVEGYYTRSGSMSLTGHRECFSSYGGPKREIEAPPELRNLDPEFLAWVN